MPKLRQIECSIELGSANIKLKEYDTLYNDGYVDTFVPVPETDINFTIHIKSSGYIAPGLAFFVFMDGEYQCNRNYLNLKLPGPGVTPREYELDVRLRQKEQQHGDETFITRDWIFTKLQKASADKAPRVNSQFLKNLGTIEVVVLRCQSNYDDDGASVLSDDTRSAIAQYDGAGDAPNKQNEAGRPPARFAATANAYADGQPIVPGQSRGQGMHGYASGMYMAQANPYGVAAGHPPGAGYTQPMHQKLRQAAPFQGHAQPQRQGWQGGIAYGPEHGQDVMAYVSYGPPSFNYAAAPEDDRNRAQWNPAHLEAMKKAHPEGNHPRITKGADGQILIDQTGFDSEMVARWGSEDPKKKKQKKAKDRKDGEKGKKGKAESNSTQSSSTKSHFDDNDGIYNPHFKPAKGPTVMPPEEVEMIMLEEAKARAKWKKNPKPADGVGAGWQRMGQGQAAPAHGWPPPLTQRYAQPAYGQPAYGQPVFGKPAYGHPAYAQSMYGQPAYPGYDQGLYGQQGYDQVVYGQPRQGQADQGGGYEQDGGQIRASHRKNSEHKQNDDGWQAQGQGQTGGNNGGWSKQSQQNNNNGGWANDEGGGDKNGGRSQHSQKENNGGGWANDAGGNDDWGAATPQEKNKGERRGSDRNDSRSKDKKDSGNGWGGNAANNGGGWDTTDNNNAAAAWGNESKKRSHHSSKQDGGNDGGAPATSNHGNNAGGSGQVKDQNNDAGSWGKAESQSKGAGGWREEKTSQKGNGGGWDNVSTKSSKEHFPRSSRASSVGSRSGSSRSTYSNASSFVKPYWKEWTKPFEKLEDSDAGSVKHRVEPRPVYTYPEEPLPPIPSEAMKGRRHAVQAGRGADYAHFCRKPVYIDSMEAPYAVFSFKYRSKETLEHDLKMKIDGSAAEKAEKQAVKDRLLSMPKDRLVKELMAKRTGM